MPTKAMCISPDTKSDDQVRAIGPSAARLALSQPARKNCPYVFPSDVGDGHFTAAKSCLSRLCATAKIEGVTPHTLRHTFGSMAGDLGFSELTQLAQLGGIFCDFARGGASRIKGLDDARG